MKLFIVAALVALVAAEPPVNYGAPGRSSPGSQYGAPSSAPNPGASYGAPGGLSQGGYNNNGNQNGGGNSAAGGYAGAGGNNGGRTSGPIESESNLELENEGANIPSDIVDQELLDRVVDALSEELAQQEAAAAAQRAATSGNYGAPAPGYGPPSSGYGAPLGNNGNGGYSQGGAGGNSAQGPGSSNGRITLLIPPDPLKAKLIANYIQRGSAPYAGNPNGNSNNGGYDNGNNRNNGGYN